MALRKKSLDLVALVGASVGLLAGPNAPAQASAVTLAYEIVPNSDQDWALSMGGGTSVRSISLISPR